MDWWNILIFGVIPIFTVMVIFFVKRKLLWIAPIISTSLVFVSYMISFISQGIHSPIVTIFSSSERRWFFLLVMLSHLAIVVAITTAAYFVAYILKRKKK